MVHKPIVRFVIAPVVLSGIILLAVVTAIPSNNHAFAFGNSFASVSPSSSDENNSSGNEQQQSNNAGNEQQQSNNAGSGQQESSSSTEDSQQIPRPCFVLTT